MCCAAHNYDGYRKDWSLTIVVVKHKIKRILYDLQWYDLYQTGIVCFLFPRQSLGIKKHIPSQIMRSYIFITRCTGI